MRMILCILCALFTFACSANAAEPYGFAGLGGSKFSTSGANDTWRPTLDEDSRFAWSVGGGLQITNNLAMELAWMDFGKVSGSGDGAMFVDDGSHKCCLVAQHGEGSARFAGASLAAVVSGQLGGVSPHLKLGAFYNPDKHEVNFVRADGVSYTTTRSNAVSPMLGVGVSFRRISLDYTWLRELNAWSTQDFTVQALTVGLRFGN